MNADKPMTTTSGASTPSIREWLLPFLDYKTWLQVAGNLHGVQTPLIVIHGGPGSTHDYLESISELAREDRAVIQYDQLGSGRSTRLPDKAGDFWTVDLFLSQLQSIIDGLGLHDGYDLFGHSWGGMLASEHAVTKPAGLRRLIIANSLASEATWIAEVQRLRGELPADVQETLLHYELLGRTDDPAYQDAYALFARRHFCRLDPLPRGFLTSERAVAEDPTVQLIMNGPNEFNVVGTMRCWTIEDRLHLVTVPTLVIRGRYDAATELCMRPFVEHIRDVRQHVFLNSSHSPHVEEKGAFLCLVEQFLMP